MHLYLQFTVPWCLAIHMMIFTMIYKYIAECNCHQFESLFISLRLYSNISLWHAGHIGPKRKIQRLLNVIFINRNFFRPIDTIRTMDPDTMGVHRAARIKIFSYPCPPLSSRVPKVIKKGPRSKFCAYVHVL